MVVDAESFDDPPYGEPQPCQVTHTSSASPSPRPLAHPTEQVQSHDILQEHVDTIGPLSYEEVRSGVPRGIVPGRLVKLVGTEVPTVWIDSSISVARSSAGVVVWRCGAGLMCSCAHQERIGMNRPCNLHEPCRCLLLRRTPDRIAIPSFSGSSPRCY